MSQSRPSRALLIVNTDFHGSGGDPVPGRRRGAKREAEKLSQMLSKLNYEVTLRLNQTAKEMEDLYQRERGHQHGDFFVSIISSHGEDGVVLGCDSEPLKLARIFQLLSSEEFPGLTRIPKIFFIQACRGGELDHGVAVECDSGEPEPDGFSDYLAIPPQSAVMFSCSPG
ncbi:CASP3 protein, partial [Aegotheles bennettii]|nr:CASP3 protein [Aegotheles bennettii]